VYEETLTGRPHDTSEQKATSDNENVDAQDDNLGQLTALRHISTERLLVPRSVAEYMIKIRR